MADTWKDMRNQAIDPAPTADEEPPSDPKTKEDQPPKVKRVYYPPHSLRPGLFDPTQRIFNVSRDV